MEAINVLQNKAKCTVLFDSVLGENVLFERLEGNRIICSNSTNREQTYKGNGKLFDNTDAIVVLTPSREMQDWEKFAWKKGDVLNWGVDALCIFDKWANSQYTEFYGRFSSQYYSKNNIIFYTKYWTKVGDNTKEIFIKRIEEFHNGKLNLETLTIEQPKQEFKDGDADTKTIEDLPKKCEFKAFDKVLVRDLEGEEWRPAFFWKEHPNTSEFVIIGGTIYSKCIPYNEETAHLLGTTDEWKGGEG